MKDMQSLNRAFEKAFAHTATKETLKDLLSCLGEELGCDRISIFEINDDRTCDNTHEWCRPGIEREQIMLQNIPMDAFDTWTDKLDRNEIIVVHDPQEIKESDPDVYHMFEMQHIDHAIVSMLAFHGGHLGFFILENPDEETMQDAELILPGMRYILSSLVYSDHLIHRLERIGYTDALTGTGNRISLQEHLEAMDPAASVGIVYCDVLGWAMDGGPKHLEREQTLLRTGEVLTNIFDEGTVFRVATGEFLVVEGGISRQEFETDLATIRGLFQEHNLEIALASTWNEQCVGSYDAMIRQAHLLVSDERKRVSEQHARRKNPAMIMEWEREDRAEIGLIREDEFFRKAEDFLSEVFDESIVTVVIDVNYFKLYNDIFGRKAGNRFLEELSHIVDEQAQKWNGIAGYLGGDNFCMMIPTGKTEAEELIPGVQSIIEALKYPDGFAPALGIYLSLDRQETMITMYDRALTALSEIKGDYIEHYRFYSAEKYQHQREDKLLLMDVKEGLPKGEFLFYVQPQVQERTGKIIGGEALVRWKHAGQIVSPGRFIPILEKTGYVFAVDTYVWESVVKWLRDLIDRGIRPVEISVNVSRVDFYFTDIAQYFIDLVKKYDVNPKLLGIEITESAFTDNTESILESVQRLHQAGFRILMDDFGSGSSSLSMLHTMNLDVLKTDVKFMSKKNSDNRAISIVESVISMAHMIGMLVVTEGVETENQRDSLIALGDNYAQGFYFFKPMPKEEFELLLQDESKVGAAPQPGDSILTNHLRFREMIRDGMVSETLLDNIIGPAAIYREDKDGLRLVQMNQQYSDVTGIAMHDREAMDHFGERFKGMNFDEIRKALDGANTHPLEGSEGAVEFTKSDGRRVLLKVRIFLLYSCDDHKLYLSTM